MKTRLRLPNLAAVAQTAKHLRQPVVIVAPSKKNEAELQKLRDRVRELEAFQQAAIDRAQREDRVKAKTLHVTDNRAAWAAKLGIRRQPFVAITPLRVITSDVWQSGHPDDA
jgi:hypothetical protein